jgi:DNA-binding GntR family transcriptional regulator
MVDVLEVRQGLEGMAAAIASGRITERQKADLLNVVEKYKAAVESANIEEIIKYDEEFHSMIISISGNKTLMQVFSTVQELALRFRYIYYDDFNRYESMPREHQLIEEAIMSGDAEKARVAAGDHVSKLKEFILNEGEKAFGNLQ